MVASTSTERRSAKATKVRALLAGGLVLGIGAAFTLAAWTDDEWVFGSSGGDNGPGTKTYHMEQNTFSNTNGTGPNVWDDKPNVPTLPNTDTDNGELTFGATSVALKPGDTTYAPMQLRAAAGSEALVATLKQGRQLDGDSTTNSSALYDVLTYEAVQGVTPAACAAGNLADGISLVQAGTDLDNVSPTNTISTPVAINLPKGTEEVPDGAAVNICFGITLPSSVTDVTLQGKQTVPLWLFTSTVGAAA